MESRLCVDFRRSHMAGAHPRTMSRAVDVVVFDGTTIGATVLVKKGGPKRPRRWDVRVTNPDGTSVVLPEALLVAP